MAVIKTDLNSRNEFDEKRFRASPLIEGEHYRALAVFLRSGQFIPVHKPDVDVVIYVHSGSGEIIAGNSKMSITAGDLIAVSKGERRGVRASTDMKLLHFVSPVPSKEDHGEVEKKLQAGQFE